jgi:SAM-dependent methyltransferase
MTEAADRIAEFRQFLGRQALRYQSVDLGVGVMTEGADRSYLNEVVFEIDISGRSLFDIGCSLGYFCIEAMRRGASSAVGMDTSPERVRHARKIAEFLNLPITYLSEDFENWNIGDFRADTVLCLNVTHHLYDPIGAIKKMMKIARERIIMEVAVVNWREILNVKGAWAVPGLSRLPVILLKQPKNLVDVADRSFLFTQASLSTLFNTHTKAFEPLRTRPSPFKGRLIVEARRRKIRHLVVVVGPTSVGKSTFCEAINYDSALASRFGIDNVSGLFVSADKIDALPSGSLDTVVLHYDLLRPFDRSMQSHWRDPVFDVLGCANEVTVINLFNNRADLQERITNAELSKSSPQRRHFHILKQYENPDFLPAWYEAWLDAVNKMTNGRAKNLFVKSGERYSEHSKQEMLRDVA